MFSLHSTNPTAVPLSSITSGVANKSSTASLPSTPSPGATPPLKGAPPLPSCMPVFLLFPLLSHISCKQSCSTIHRGIPPLTRYRLQTRIKSKSGSKRYKIQVLASLTLMHRFPVDAQPIQASLPIHPVAGGRVDNVLALRISSPVLIRSV